MSRFIFVLFFMVYVPLNADFLRLEVGGGIWGNDVSGDITDNGDKSDLESETTLGSENSPYFWVLFRHPVPVIPNARIEYTDVAYEGKIKEGKEFGLGDKTFEANANLDLKFSQTDYILYYNLLDETFFMTLDIGLDARVYNGYIKASSGNSDEKVKLNFAIPMAYARARVDFPILIEMGVEVEGKYVGVGKSYIYDYIAKADMVLVDAFIITMGLEAGYRIQGMSIENDKIKKGIEANMQFDGLFAGLFVKF